MVTLCSRRFNQISVINLLNPIKQIIISLPPKNIEFIQHYHDFSSLIIIFACLFSFAVFLMNERSFSLNNFNSH